MSYSYSVVKLMSICQPRHIVALALVVCCIYYNYRFYFSFNRSVEVSGEGAHSTSPEKYHGTCFEIVHKYILYLPTLFTIVIHCCICIASALKLEAVLPTLLLLWTTLNDLCHIFRYMWLLWRSGENPYLPSHLVANPKKTEI